MKTSERAKAYLHHTNELGRLSQLAVATGLVKCDNERISSKIILRGKLQSFSSGHMHYKKAQAPFYIVHLFVGPMHLR